VATGKVKWWDSTKEYGFITHDDGGEVFVRSGNLAAGTTVLRQGQRVEFEVEEGRRGAQALQVRILEAPRAVARKGRSVFISYRRQLSESVALLVRRDLVEHHIDAFVDTENLDSGEFEQRILRQIEAREHFIVLLEPGSLDRIGQYGDWLRREIAHALARSSPQADWPTRLTRW
jgi:cold shock CspA family protein